MHVLRHILNDILPRDENWPPRSALPRLLRRGRGGWHCYAAASTAALRAPREIGGHSIVRVPRNELAC